MSEMSSRDPASRDRTLRDQTWRDNATSVAAISSERTDSDDNVWTRRLVLFLRIMAVISMLQGLYHWAQVTGFVGGEDDAFEVQPLAWQTATVYFAVIELVAAVGMWLATPWGAVVWRQPHCCWSRTRMSRGLSGAGLDGCAGATAIAKPTASM
jgi:fatty acid desaturase